MRSIDNWQAHSLRLTVFPLEAQSDTGSWWADVVGEIPARQQALPRESRREEAAPVAVDVLLDAELLLRVQTSRIDWVLQQGAGSSARAIALPVIGPFRAAAGVFGGFVERWLRICPPVYRLAFGALVFLPVSSRTEGYSVLSELLPFKVDGEDTSDFMYQINRPRKAKSDGWEYKLNRLAKWAVARFEVLEVEIPSGGKSAREIGNACQVELDVNTAPGDERQMLPGDQLIAIFSQLVEAGEEILTQGDIP